ncbi:MAG: M20/M25/M40 family metallo-hydrolase [Lysobacter sp.]|nr:M20/M25/M40 family metallo-hydrolase [Lysobacter sp.]
MRNPLTGALLALLVTTPCFAADLTPDQSQAREIYAKLISYKTSEGLGQVPVMAGWLADEFRKAGFPDADIHLLPVGETASLVVRYRGDGSGGKPILLMAHMDVVAADPNDWKRDPFKLIEENGYFFGRGTSDVKDGIATLTATFLRLKKEGFVPTRDLVIVFTGDEETEMATTRDLVDNHRDLVDADYALNYDGGGGTLEEDGTARTFSIQTAEKAYADFELSTHDAGGHSSRPTPTNAIYQLADALKNVQAYRFPTKWNDTTLAEFAAEGKVAPGELGAAMRAYAKNPQDNAAVEALAADPGNVGRTRTTCVATMLRGGHGRNALPQSATANVNCRIFPGTSIEDVRNTLQEVAGKNVEVKTIGKPVSSEASPLRPDVVDAVTRAVHTLYPNIAIVPNQSSGATDGMYFRNAGIPTYGVGGMFMKDSDAFAHGLDERVPVKGFYDGLSYWYTLLKDVGGKH